MWELVEEHGHLQAACKVVAEHCLVNQDGMALQTVAGVAAVRQEEQMIRKVMERWAGRRPSQRMVVRRMVQVVLVVRLPLPAHVVDMTDGRCGSIGAEVPMDEAMMSVSAPTNYTKDQGQRVGEAVAYSTKGQATEWVTVLDANHK